MVGKTCPPFSHLNLLAFAFHTVAEATQDLWQKAATITGTRAGLFTKMRETAALLLVSSWRNLFEILGHLPIRLAVVRSQGRSLPQPRTRLFSLPVVLTKKARAIEAACPCAFLKAQINQLPASPRGLDAKTRLAIDRDLIPDRHNENSCPPRRSGSGQASTV